MRHYADLVEALTAVLKGANFVEMSLAEIEQAHRERKVMRVEVEAPVDDFREIRFFRRGHHTEAIEIQRVVRAAQADPIEPCLRRRRAVRGDEACNRDRLEARKESGSSGARSGPARC